MSKSVSPLNNLKEKGKIRERNWFVWLDKIKFDTGGQSDDSMQSGSSSLQVPSSQ